MGPVIERLLADGAIDAATLGEGREIAEGAGLPLVRVLLHLKLVDPNGVAAALSAVTGRNVVSLDKFPLPPSPVPYFSEGICRELRVLPLAFEQGAEGPQLVLAMSDPTDQNAGERVAEITGKNVRPLLVDDAALARAIAKRYGEQPPSRSLRPPPPAGATQLDGEVLLLEEVDEPSKTDPAPRESTTTSAERPHVAAPAPAPTPAPSDEADRDEDDAPTLKQIARHKAKAPIVADVPDAAAYAATKLTEPAPRLLSEPNLRINDPSQEVFARMNDAPVERTVIMRAPAAPSVLPRDRTVLKRNPFLDPISASGATEMRSVIGDARVCFVSRDARARLRVAADLAPIVHDALVMDDLKRAADIAEKEEFDEIVLHSPKPEPLTREYINRMARALGHGVVVISSELTFDDLPAVRRRLPPATAQEIAGIILDGLFASPDE